MLAAEGVPGAEHRVAFPALGPVHFAVHAPVFAVGVGVQRRVYAGMVEGCVETSPVLEVVVGAFELAHIGLPGPSGGFFLAGEGPAALGFKVGSGVLFRHA